jgi:CheY-like chemotaxis protein
MTQRVLVVDDDEVTRSAIVGLLSGEGCVVDACEDGEQALARLRSGSYDVLLTDQVMPRMSGIELVASAKVLSSGLRCLVMSGRARPEGATGVVWISKPIDVDALLEHVLA